MYLVYAFRTSHSTGKNTDSTVYIPITGVKYGNMSIVINPATTKPPTRDNANPPTHLPVAKTEKQHPSKAGGENASVYFVGTATTIL